jgi:TonB family protein
VKNLLGCFALGLLTLLPARAAVQADEAAALLRDWVQPVYPEAARQARAEGRVVVNFVVEPDGQVTRLSVEKSSDPQFNESALVAVQRWGFSPALSDGKPVASALRVPVVFRLEQLKQRKVPLQPPEDLLPVPLPRIPPKMKISPNPAYPAELEEQQLSGRVELEFVVGTDGVAHAPKVLWASDAAFVGAALQATQQAPMEFESLGVNRAALLAANHLEPVTKEGYQQLPQPQVLGAPVYPREQLLAGETGAATVEFTVSDRGGTENARLVFATRPEFGAALLAAVESWVFNPAQNEGRLVPANLRVIHEFAPPLSGPVAGLLPAMRPGGPGIGGAGGLDRRLSPLWRGFPVYPQRLRAERPAGRAVIEFIVDREGRARLPRVVSATHDAFGWAAAAAISQWVFEPPQRQGQATEVRVSIPVDFSPPAD